MSEKTLGVDILTCGRCLLRQMELEMQLYSLKNGASGTGTPSIEVYCSRVLFFLLWNPEPPLATPCGHLSLIRMPKINENYYCCLMHDFWNMNFYARARKTLHEFEEILQVSDCSFVHFFIFYFSRCVCLN